LPALQAGTLGYHLACRFRQPARWRWLPAPIEIWSVPSDEDPITSALRHINPTFEMFKRGS
jgi:hypothetical protein